MPGHLTESGCDTAVVVIAKRLRLETDRCLIRAFRPDDVEAALAYLGDPVVMEFIEPCYSREQTSAFLRTAGGGPAPLVHAVEQRSTHLLIGHVIFHRWQGSPAWELGWILRKDVWGRGIATELSRALITHAFGEGGVTQLVAECVPENHASIAVMEKVGLVRAPQLDRDLPVWSITKP